MPVYKYKAMRMTGERIEKICSSANREELFSRLKQQGYYPIHIEETVESREIKNISLLKGFRVTIKDIAIFCRQFYTMLNAGVPIITCLDIMRSQTENKKLRKTLSKVYEGIQRGMTFSEALKNYSDVFPNLFIYIVEAGEITGNLDSIMNRVALYYEKENSIRNKVKAAMVYPFILLVVSVCIIIFLLIFVIPMFVAMFESNSAKLPFITRLFFVLSHGMIRYGYMILFVIFILIYGRKKLYQIEQCCWIRDYLKLKIPLIQKVNLKIIISRFTRTLSILLESGISLIEALEVVSKIVENKVIENEILEVKEEIRIGMDFAMSIKKVTIFPPMVHSMIAIGEQSGKLHEILDKTAKFYDEEVEVSLQKMVTLLEPFMVTIMALVIGLIVLAIVLPMFEMINIIPV